MLARPDSIVAALHEIANAEGSVLVHCAAGKDRTGTVVALALDVAGVSRELIAGDYLATAGRIELIIDRLRSSDTYRAELEGHDPQDQRRCGRSSAYSRSSTRITVARRAGCSTTASAKQTSSACASAAPAARQRIGS